MMMPSNIIIFQISISVLLMTTLTTTTIIPQATEMLSETSHSYDDERNPAAVIANDHHRVDAFPASSKHIAFTDDDSASEEQDDIEYLPIYHYEAFQPQIINQHHADRIIRGIGSTGDKRLSAIPYRFGKRAAMPYRFGKRAAMPYRFGKRAGMHFRLGKKSAAL